MTGRLLFAFALTICCVPVLLESSSKDSCFCQLKGGIDDCSCEVENVDSFNNLKIYPRLNSLLQQDYFKYYKLNLFRPCPFATDSIGKCASRSCAVDECKEDQLPEGLKKNHSHKSKYTKEAQAESCEEEQNELGDLDTHISEESKEAFKTWKKYDESQDNFCEPEDVDSPSAMYYDLVRNPERFTGYTGPSAVNVWKLIYDQNCFKPDKTDYASYLTQQENCLHNGTERTNPKIDTRNGTHNLRLNDSGNVLQGMCLEKRVFFRLISGFHTSINVDVTANWLIPGKTLFDKGTWGPNLEEFRKRFDPDQTYGEGPQRLKNLYFAYLVELRALAKAAPYLEQELYYTGSENEDNAIKDAVHELLEAVKTFPNHFDESKLFRGDAKKLKENFKVHFRNISRIMDCVGCDKCRLWGKLQITGMGTALKILFSGDSMGPESTVTQEHKKSQVPFQLTRTEIVALFNSIGRLSQSIHELENFRKLSS